MEPSSRVIACIKWAPPVSSVDFAPDERFAGMSMADQAALELALRTADATGDDVVVLTVGPAGADKIAREALASGATRAIRIDAPADVPSNVAASAAAKVLGELGLIRLVWCGDYSPDRGSGSFPAFLAAHMNLEQMLGLIRAEFPTTGAFPLEVVRRLDGGRRERAMVRSNAVLSVEGSLAKLRRASLSGTLAAQSRNIDVIASDMFASDMATALAASGDSPVVRPYRPRARTVPPPAGATPLDRIRAVTESSTPKGSGEPVELDPGHAAQLILDRLREWGYVE